MRRVMVTLMFFVLCLLASAPAFAQSALGIISGSVKDSVGSVLQGAKIVLQPQVRPVSTDELGEFTVTEVPPGNYSVVISYVGFEPFTTTVTVVAGQTAQIAAVLKVGTRSDEVIVTADRPHGEAEAINRTLAAENILQVLPADVIVSLPNANIADALGRMASVTIERDEGEGKYVQIRGTEPRLSNTMVDGVTIPSPESGVRQIKLDTIASDLVESVEINKTLQANIDGDGIGGSVNLVTKTAGEEPTATLYGVGGYTPIVGGREVDQMGGTIGKRFLANKKLGVLIGGTYDYNGRGINDIEPDPQPNPDGTVKPYWDTMDLRDYVYDRTRWGATGSVDYKLGEGSSISVRTLFSTFRNWGHKWVYTMVDGGNPQFGQDWRRPNMAVGNLALEGKHTFGSNTILWSTSVGRSRSLSGSGGANYLWVGDQNNNCAEAPGVSEYRPGFAGCLGTGQDNALDVNNYGFTEFDNPTYGQSVQLNLQASASYARFYHVGTHYGTFEFGAKIRNAHKFDDTYDTYWTTPAYSASDPEPVINGNTLSLSDGDPIPIPVSAHPEWDGTFTDPNYYDGTYKFGTVVDYGKLRGWVNTNQGQLVFNTDQGPNKGNFDLIERIPAGYLMNTIDLSSRIRTVIGLRFEATHVDTTSFDKSTNALSFKAGGDYLDVLPSGSVRFALTRDSDLRLVYGRGLSRPDPEDITAVIGIPVTNQNPNTVSAGNPALKDEHANDYDILYERSFKNAGLLQAGYFYKDLSDPIITVTTLVNSTPYNPNPNPPGAKTQITQPGNAGSAHVQGVEFSYQQRLTYLPGVLGGAGISANYSYTESRANGLPNRSDSPALQRDAPNSWNISPTYDTRRFSMRVGMSFDGTMIYQYNWTDGADPVSGVHGPLGDNYLYSHFQFDTQASYKLAYGFQAYAYGLNLNNEVFGFYNGSPQYVVQREYYHPTYAGGIRWTSSNEK